MKAVRLGWVAGTVVFVVGLTVRLSAAAPSLQVSLEVTQGIQYVDHANEKANSVPLVGGRRTVVRTRVDVSNAPAGAKASDVEATLKVTTAGTPAAPPALTSTDPFNRDRFLQVLKDGRTYERGSADTTLNFLLEGLQSGSWDFVVSVEITYDDGTQAKGDGKAERLEARSTVPVQIHLVPIIFKTHCGEQYGPPARADLEDSVDFLRACHPLPDAVTVVWKSAENLLREDSGLYRHIDHYDVPGDSRGSDVQVVLSGLESLRMTEVRNGAVDAGTFVYGWVSQDPAGDSVITDEHFLHVLGYSQGRAGFGITQPGVAGKTFAHEFGHMLGLDHAECPSVHRSCSMDRQVGWNVYESPEPTIRPADCQGYMRCGDDVTVEGIWAPPEDYQDCVTRLTSAAPGGVPTSGPIGDPLVARAVVVHGALSSDGSQVAWLDPAFRFPWKLPITPEGSSGAYEVEIADEARTVVEVRRFDGVIRVESAEGPARKTYGFFSVVLPFPSDKDVHSLTIRKGPTELRTITRTLTLPELENLSVSSGATIDKLTEIAWGVQDDDSKPQDMLYHVVFSPNAGGHFTAVCVNLREMRFPFDPSRFAPSPEKEGLIRIFASDGLNTVWTDIAQLTVRAQ